MLAAVDIGTNSLRLLYGETQGETVLPKVYLRETTRLGGGYKKGRGLAPESIERTLLALGGFTDFLSKNPVRTIRVVATAGLRMAENRDLFLDRVKQTTPFDVEIVTGAEEARLAARGVLSALHPRPRRALIFDIGGGSCEFLLVDEDRIKKVLSYPIGVVTLSEAGDYTRSVSRMLNQLRCDLGPALCSLIEDPQTALVGTAGTVTTLAALHLAMVDYDWRRVNNLCLDRGAVEAWEHRLLALSVAEREGLPGMEKGRGDLVPAGVAIITGLLKLFSKSELVVSDFGLLEGVLLSLQ